MPIPSRATSLSRSIVSSIPWSSVFPSSSATSETSIDYSGWSSSYRPEAGVVNFYQLRDTLMAHVDQSEVDTVKPLISISLGESAIFLLGSETRDEIPLPLLLRSGDVVVMSGQSRRVFHGVPRIVEGMMREGLLLDSESHDGSEVWQGCEDSREIEDFIKGTRINVNVRHVFSKP